MEGRHVEPRRLKHRCRGHRRGRRRRRWNRDEVQQPSIAVHVHRSHSGNGQRRITAVQAA